MKNEQDKSFEKTIMRNFGLNIRARRKELKMSQEELAKKALIHWSYISSIERGKRNISLINICKLAIALNCRIEILFGANILPNSHESEKPQNGNSSRIDV